MFAVLLVLLLQSTGSISGGLEIPEGMPAPKTAQVVLLPPQYAIAYDAQVQQRLDDYWEAYKSRFAVQKELFYQVMPIARRDALDSIVYQMRRDQKIKIADFVKNAQGVQFEFRGLPPGSYKLVATASIRDKDYVWMESVEVSTAPVFLLMKNRVP